MFSKLSLIVSLQLLVLNPFITGLATATMPGKSGEPLPPVMLDKLKSNPRLLSYKRSLSRVTERALLARALSATQFVGDETLAMARKNLTLKALGFTKGIDSLEVETGIHGTRNIPVIPILFSNTKTPPFKPQALQQELFDGPWPTGTMQDYYKEVSGGALKVNGSVWPWTQLSKEDTYYEGKDYIEDGQIKHCHSFCSLDPPVRHLLTETLDLSGKIDWGQYDNDGPDGIANSVDDDGYVDFVAFVHPEVGGECGKNPNIWSHRSSLSQMGGKEYTTKSRRKNGGFIKVDDYVVMPSLACDGSTMIQIGVFAHEFGHAFGLPDLYDTDPSNGESSGVGTWCLMSGGSWGGDGDSPEQPSHMSVWAKEFLGWIDIETLTSTSISLMIDDLHTSKKAYRINASSSIYYLLGNMKRSGFDQKLHADGLQVWKINSKVIQATMGNNRVNADQTNRGVELVEADGLNGLDRKGFDGGPGDVFPGSSDKRTFDSTTTPSVAGKFALCNIGNPGPTMAVSILIGQDNCNTIPPRVGEMAPPLHSQPQAATILQSLEAASSLPEGATIIFRGTPKNLGKSLFDRKSRRIVVEDTKGHQVDAEILVPFEIPPAQKHSPVENPSQMSSILGKEAEMMGRVGRHEIDGKVVTFIEIKSFKELPK